MTFSSLLFSGNASAQNTYVENYKSFLVEVRAQLAQEDRTDDDFVFSKSVIADPRSLCEKAHHQTVATFRSLSEAAAKMVTSAGEELRGQKDLPKSDGLFLFLHGLKDGPSQWRLAVRDVEKFHQNHFANFTLFNPAIPHYGDGPVDALIQPYLDIITRFLANGENEDKPIILVGTSNGARLALHLSNIFANIKNPIFVVSLAGAHYGTQMINLAKSVGAGRLGGGPDIQKDLSFGSLYSKETIAAAQILHKDKNNHAFFFASAEADALVQAWGHFPSHPKLNHCPTKHLHVSGVGHWSIPNGVFHQALVDIHRWRLSGYKKLDREVADLRGCHLVDSFSEKNLL